MKRLLGSFSSNSYIAGHKKKKPICVVSLKLRALCRGGKALLAVSTN